ncbi:uncharacterized protein LOC143241113 [Tachypleus tridentatus]|uniref:uncharacterized protein LOC143241113 n=1 Tax=Tachypleus tridentatus TaxID=6853 RepID=UPI003FD5E4E6
MNKEVLLASEIFDSPGPGKGCKMKCVHLSGAQKRKLARKKQQQKALDLVAKIGKLIFFTQLTQHDLSNQKPSLPSEVNYSASDSYKIEVEPSSTPTIIHCTTIVLKSLAS